MILVTGATGNIGSELVEQLVRKGEALRVVTRDPKKVAHLDARIERVIGDLSEEETIKRAVKGVDSIFMFPLLYDQNHKSNRALLKSAKEAGVAKVVMLSSMGAARADNEIGRLHREKEELVESSGIPWTLLRPGSFMTNTYQWLPMIKHQNKVFNPTGDGKVAPISPRDIAAVAVTALTNEGHDGKIYELTGPELLSAREQVAELAKATGIKIECVDVPVGAAADQARKGGVPDFVVDGLTKLWEHIKEGRSARKTEEVEKLTGQAGETFKQWCEKHRDAFLN